MSMLGKSVHEVPGNGTGKSNSHVHLESLLEELETNPRVAELQSGVPVVREPSRHAGASVSVADRASDERIEKIPAVVSHASRIGEVSYSQVVYRDKDDV